MSHTFYNGLWAEAQQEFRSLISEEKKILPGVEQDSFKLFEFLSDLYIKYISVFKKIDTVYDQVVHPQKRPLVRKLLDLSIVRLLELRQVFVDTELSEFFYFDYFIQWMQWIPFLDLEIDTPKYYYHERGAEFALREKWLEDECQRKLKEEEEAESALKILEEGTGGTPGGFLSEFDDDRDVNLRSGSGSASGMSYEKAILVIQTAERARQGRARYEMAKYIFEEEERSKIRKKRQRQQIMEPNQAAIIIQRSVRRFVAYRFVQRRRNEELEFLGLSQGNPNNVNSPLGQLVQKSRQYKIKIESHAESRRSLQRRFQKTFLESEQIIDSRLRLLEAAQMQETLKSQLRDWILAVKERTGKLPDIPKSEFGGMKFLLSLQKSMDDMSIKGEGRGPGAPSELSIKDKSQFGGESQSQMGGKKKKKGGSGKDKDKEKGGKKKGKGGKSKGASGGGGGESRSTDSGFLEPPVFLEQMIDANVEYNSNWRHRDEGHNPHQSHEDELIIYSKREILAHEIRMQVDVMMRAELTLLRDALQRKKGKKAKKGKKSGKSGRGSKKKGKKKKRGKDLTPDRTLESLYTELVYNGVIQKYPKIRFEDLYGESSLVNGTVRRYNTTPACRAGRADSVTGAGTGTGNDSGIDTGMETDNSGGALGPVDEEMEGMSMPMSRSKNFPTNPNPSPSFGDIKRAMKEICVLPVGSLTVHQMAPFTKSLLLTGPEGSGKKSLLYAVCTELGATLFDLTPANIAGKYPGKPGLNMLMHLIAKVGRLAQPTVYFIDEVEKTFQKRVPKTDKTEPKRLKKHLAKFIKTIGPDDQMIMISLSAEPWHIPVKLLKKDFQKILYIPKPSHGDRIILWRSLLSPHYDELHYDVNFSLLAKLSDGWSMGSINECVHNITRKHYTSLEEERGRQKHVPSQSMPSSSSGSGSGVVRVGRKLIRMDDFLKELSLLDPLFLEQEKLWNSWFAKTPMQKMRLAAQEVKTEGKAKGKKGKGKKGKK